MSKRSWICVAAAIVLAAALIALWFLMRGIERQDPTAEIYRDGELVRSVPLTEECQFVVECEAGFNQITVQDGEIFVSDADCPDKVCVHTGAISGGAVPIVCLPHRLEIRVVNGNGSVDAQL